MEEEVTNKENESESSPLGKKYIYTWRNKWITSKAGTIDDFIEIYEHLTEHMRRWKEEGIVLDPDIDGGVGDDYAQFCTYDEKVAIKEGFEEEEFEDYEEVLGEEEFSILKFQVNEYLSLKLIDPLIQIYVNGEKFTQCRYLLIVDPLSNENQDEIGSIDEVELFYNKDLEEKVRPKDIGITKEQEFWAHCSNLQAWAENNYDTRLLHSNLSFPLLKKLTEVGDTKATKVFKEEIARRFVSGYLPVTRYLFREKYLDFLTQEEFEVILDELNYTALDLNALLVNIEDYRLSKYGNSFLVRIKEEFSEFFTHNTMYVEVVSHHVDKSEFSPIVITPDRQYFVRGSNDGKLKVFGIFEGDLVRVFGDHKGQSVNTIALSKDGKCIASSADTLVKVWDYRTGMLLHTFDGHQDSINALVFDPDRRVLVSGSSDYDMNECEIKVWDLSKGELKMTLDSHWRAITSLSFSPDGKYFVSGAFDKTVNVWDASTGRLITTLVGHKHAVIAVAITDDRRVISASYDGTMRVWDIDTGKELGYIGFRNSENGRERFGPVSFVLTPDQQFVVSGLQSSLEEAAMLSIWKLSDRKLVQTLPITQDFAGYYEELNNIAISNDGVYVVSASRERMVKVWMEFREYMKFQEIMEDMYK